MANNKMLIDASHPEETRVVVVRGNRIEEFDFEAQERKQLRGNIYLAKVTRVEPSLQAAFVDYGGNRHGFLAFSEIHPDYYQIPAADRQALLAEEEAAAAEAEAEEDAEALIEADDDEAEEAPAPKRSRRRGKRSRSDRTRQAAADTGEDGDDEAADGSAEAADNETAAETAQETVEAVDGEAEEAGKAEKPKRKPRAAAKPRARKTSRKKAADSDAEAGGDAAEDNAADEGGEESGKTMAAAMDADSISEPAPPAGDGDDTGDDEDSERAGEPAADDGEAEADAKPEARKRKPRAAKARKKKAETGDDEVAAEDGGEKPKKGRSKTTEEAVEAEATGEEAEEAPKKTRRSRRKKKSRDEADDATGKQAAPENGEDGDGQPDAPDAGGNGGGSAAPVESVGQDDALEEGRIKRPRRQYKIQEVIRRRQVMLVQVVKEERGNKGAALTTYLSLAGRYSVLMPNTARGGGISRKITNLADRKRLKSIAQALDVPKGMGVILRTAGASREQEEIQRDFDYLMRLWDNVRNLTLASTAPILVYEEGSLIKRSIRDLYNKDIGEIVVSGEAGYEEARDFMNMLMPSHEKNVKLYTGDQPILSRYNIESQLEKMVTPQVTLKSGGYLIINQTEALVAIDVNSGKSTREHSIEATALQTNLEAAEEVARQLRLRDLAGLIVIDFIDMEEKRNNRSVERKLKECLKNDRARIQVGHISHFGLLEMSRQRIRASVLESTMAVCPVCHGVGHVRSQSSLALMILRALEDYLNRSSRNDVSVKVSPSMAMYILNTKRRALSSMEQRFGLQILVEADHDIGDQDYAIEKGDPATGNPDSSAVNMMHGSTPFDHETDHEAGHQTSPETGHETGDDEESGRSKRGRRRRGRGRDRDRDDRDDRDGRSSRQAARDGEDGPETDTAADDGDEDRAERGTAPAARQNGGRDDARARKHSARDDRPAAPAAATPQETAAGRDEDDDAESRRLKRRTGRPGKKVKAEETGKNAETAEEADTDDGTREAAPPRQVQRRNTRRVKKGEASGENGEEENQAGWSGFLS